MTLWTVASQAPLSMGFPRQENWSGLLYASPGDLPHPGIEPALPVSPALQADSLPAEPLVVTITVYPPPVYRRGGRDPDKRSLRWARMGWLSFSKGSSWVNELRSLGELATQAWSLCCLVQLEKKKKKENLEGVSLVLAVRLAMESLGSGLSPADSRHSGPHGSQLVGGRGL